VVKNEIPTFRTLVLYQKYEHKQKKVCQVDNVGCDNETNFLCAATGEIRSNYNHELKMLQ